MKDRLEMKKHVILQIDGKRQGWRRMEVKRLQPLSMYFFALFNRKDCFVILKVIPGQCGKFER